MNLNVQALLVSEDELNLEVTAVDMPSGSYLELVSNSQDLSMNSCSKFREENGKASGSMLVTPGIECEISVIKQITYLSQGRLILSTNNNLIEYDVTKKYQLTWNIQG